MLAENRNEIEDRRPHILVVDDEPFNLEIMEEILSVDFRISLANSGPSALQMITQNPPDIVLLDINMPGMSGYEVCQQIKQNAQNPQTHVMFVSALDTLAERLAGYEVGGDDYITKPFEARELLSKVKLIIKNKEAQERLQQNAKEAMSTAMNAMVHTSDLGAILQFMRVSFSCNDYESLAVQVLETMMSLGIRSSVQIRIGDNVITKSTDGVVNQLESTVMRRIHKEDRIIDFGNRTVINYDHISILMKSMPLDDPEKYGRYKDNIALLAEGAEARVNGILVDRNLQRKQLGLIKMVDSAQNALKQIEEKHNEHKVLSMKILADLIFNVESSFSFLDLAEHQERAFMEMVNNAVKATISLYNEGLDVDAKLANVVEDLNEVMANHD